MNHIDEIHRGAFGTAPLAVASAPARFHLMGEHSWFFRDKTLSLAIDVPVLVSVSRRSDDFFHYFLAQKSDLKKTTVFPLKVKKDDRWANFIKSAIFGLESVGVSLPGLDFTLSTQMQPSDGFGIAIAIQAATAFAINEALSLGIPDSRLLRAVEIGSREFLRGQSFLADNFTAFFSEKDSFMLTDHARGVFETVPFDFSGKSLIIISTKVPRFESWHEDALHEPAFALLMGDLKKEKSNVLGGWVYDENLADIHETLASCGEKNIRKLIALIREHRCVLDAYEGLSSGAFGTFARAVNMSHENMRDYYEISCPEIDWILKRLVSITPNLADPRNPFSCGRITGRGSDRCIYSFLPDENISALEEKLSEFERIFGFRARYFKAKSVDGVKIVS